MARRTRKKKKKTALGCLVWFALVLVITVVFLVARPSIIRAVEGSGLAELFGRKAEPPVTTSTVVAPAPASPAVPETGPVVTVDPTPARAAPEPGPAAEPVVTPRTPAPSQPKPSPTAATPAATRAPAAARPAEVARHKRTSTLYFIRQDDAGVSVGGLPREVSYTDSPLTDTLTALLSGPTASETAKGYLSLIPEGTRVESVQVKGGTAFVSFNERFRFNPYGRDGLAAQLRQVVWTMTEFDSVKAVQILIGGKVTDYLGPEGLMIRDPLSRESLGSL